MVKRKSVKVLSNDSESGSGDFDNGEDFDSPDALSETTSNKKGTGKKDERVAKKPKLNAHASTSKHESSANDEISNHQSKVHINTEGDKYVDLGKKKRAVVRSFKGIGLVDIREYYGADGEEKPGKKGISLTLEQVRISGHLSVWDATHFQIQWEALKESTSTIDQLFSQLKKK
ncbi:transcriptional Coactivator p15-domain-containing protein [Crassisporium funariophilum]|nr:transcriptional Coactivator p15-domain-containing protein [Crassisporium funariophilum]